MTQPPGFLTLGAADYHADLLGDDGPPSLSASIASILVSASPAHARAQHPRLNPGYKPVEEKKFDLGRAAHQVMLEGNASVAVIDAPDWRTKDAKTAREWARESGLTPLLQADWETVQAMVEAAKRQLAEFDIDPLPFTNGQPEVTIVWEDHGVSCKARIDWLHDGNGAISDLKTTSRTANPETWCKSTLWSIGADIQTRMYQRGVAALTGNEPDFRYVVVETYAPFALSIVELAPSAKALADAKIETALRLWKECLASNRWPAYSQRVAYAEPPAWHEAMWLEREAREEVVA